MPRDIETIAADIAAVDSERCEYESETLRLVYEVKAKRSDGLSEISRRLSALKREQQEARDAAVVPHEWEGRKVTRDEVKYSRSWRGGEKSRTPVFGIVETATSQTQSPANCRYSVPRVGLPIVRLLKKDGTPGLKFETLARYEHQEQWKLAE